MTNRELDNAIALMQAHRDGKTIQVYDYSEETWLDLTEPNWDFVSFIYRVKPDEPKPHYRPFKSAEEVMAAIREHGGWITDGITYRLLKKFTIAENGKIIYSFSGLQDRIYDSLDFHFADGTPFGKSEE